MAKELCKESMPIILDEAFAYYDEERLENILKYLITTKRINRIADNIEDILAANSVIFIYFL